MVRQTEVLTVLRGQGDKWIGRTELAKALGRKKLNPLDLQALAVLETVGQIEVERRPDTRPAGFVAYYRVKA